MKPTAKVVALVGNPNSGKTTLFNALTGSRQAVGNWPGVTVEKKYGHYANAGTHYNVVDLPGTYALADEAAAKAVDEQITYKFLQQRQADVVLNVIDASNLERNLYLTTQLLEMNIPVIVVLNMTDIIEKRGLVIDSKQLSTLLSAPVIEVSAGKKRGIAALKSLIAEVDWVSPYHVPAYPTQVETLLSDIVKHGFSRWQAIRYLEYREGHDAQLSVFSDDARQIEQVLSEELDILFADYRYQFIESITEQVLTQTGDHSQAAESTFTRRLDKILLNRYLGIPIFFAVMYFMFFFAINIGGAFQDFFDIASSTLFVDGLSHFLTAQAVPDWLNVLLSNGVGRGINTIVTFIPVIGAMFLMLAFLEDTGYMARAAFVMDRLMRSIGLPGKSFVPMIVGFGCNVPAIMGARTLEKKKDRILVIMMSPFMSCGARLSVFALFAAAFFPNQSSLMIFSLYLIGIVVAVLTGLMLHRSVLSGDSSSLVLEMPPYRMPTIFSMIYQAWHKLKKFIFKAGKIIMPVVVVLGILSSITWQGQFVTENHSDSILAKTGKAIVPVFTPMGIEEDNWQATVGIFSGVLAKEVVVGTLNSLYSFDVEQNVPSEFSISKGMHDALETIPENIRGLVDALRNPISAGNIDEEAASASMLGNMQSRFDGKIGAFAYLLFVLLYMPCISATAAIGRELNQKWMMFSLAWTSIVAYSSAVIFYQLATFLRHPQQSLFWVSGCFLIITLFVSLLFMQARKEKVHENRYAGVLP